MDPQQLPNRKAARRSAPPSHSTLYVVVETRLKVKREANGLVDLPTTYIEIRTTQSLNDEPEV